MLPAVFACSDATEKELRKRRKSDGFDAAVSILAHNFVHCESAARIARETGRRLGGGSLRFRGIHLVTAAIEFGYLERIFIEETFSACLQQESNLVRGFSESEGTPLGIVSNPTLFCTKTSLVVGCLST